MKISFSITYNVPINYIVTELLLSIALGILQYSIFINAKFLVYNLHLGNGSKFYHGIQGVLATYHTQLETSRTGLSVDGHLCLYELGGQHRKTSTFIDVWFVSQFFFVYTYMHTFDTDFTWQLTRYIMCCLKKKLYRDRNVH